VIASVLGDSEPERLARPVFISEQKARLCSSGVGVIRPVLLPLEDRQHLSGQQSGPLDVASEQHEGGGVDGGVIAARARVDGGIGLGCLLGVTTPSLAVSGERKVLLDPRTESRYLVVVNGAKSELGKASGGLVRGSGSGQGEDAPVLQAEIVRIPLEPTVGEVYLRKEFPAPFFPTNRLQPFVRRRWLRAWCQTRPMGAR